MDPVVEDNKLKDAVQTRPSRVERKKNIVAINGKARTIIIAQPREKNELKEAQP
jgi:hypothetical protein